MTDNDDFETSAATPQATQRSSLGELRARIAALEVGHEMIRATHKALTDGVSMFNHAEENRRILEHDARLEEMIDATSYRATMRERMPTLRDQFAQSALNGLLAAEARRPAQNRAMNDHLLAAEAYAVADALMIQRAEKKKTETP